MRPQTFAAWKDCITKDCGIELTKEFALKRLAVYQDPENKETKKFATLYGEEHLNNVIRWFSQVSTE